MDPYYADGSVTLYHGDALETLRSMPAASVNACVTSPPYFGLRHYGSEGQYGLEGTPDAYVERMRALFAEVRRVLASDGTLWLNLGDSYGPGKQMLGMPWRVALALQSDGWTLRNDVIWAKPNGMPESVADRLSLKHEHLFLLTKGERYWFDLDPIREPHAESSLVRATRSRFTEDKSQAGVGSPNTMDPRQSVHPAGKNPGDVWAVNTQPFRGAHFAVMPPEIARRCITTGCKPGGVVLDPFSGSGTTGLAAGQHGRRYVGIDISSEYLDLSLGTRLAQGALSFEETA